MSSYLSRRGRIAIAAVMTALCLVVLGPSVLLAQDDALMDDVENNAVPSGHTELSPHEQLIAILAGSAMLAFGITLNVLNCFMLSQALRTLPPEFRLMEPGQPWLLLIPCFNFVWNFFVYQRVAQSYKNYFHQALRRMDVGDCGVGIGLAFSICYVFTMMLSLVPCIGAIFVVFLGPATFILMIVYLVKILGLKREVERSTVTIFEP